MLPFSVIVITLNEQKNIARCLDSVPFASEKIVLDSGSEDRTVELAKSRGARVFIEPFRGYGPQKERAAAIARYEWVLWLDADEALDEVAQAALQELVTSGNPTADAYRFARQSFHLGRWIQAGGWYPDWQTRFFNKKKIKWNHAEVHEGIVAEKVETLNGRILHWVFDDLSDQVRTNDRYSSLGAKELAKNGKRFSLAKLILKPWSKFIETYIYKRGFRDGLPGFIIAVGAAYSVFLKFAKLWEIEQSQSGPKSDLEKSDS